MDHNLQICPVVLIGPVVGVQSHDLSNEPFLEKVFILDSAFLEKNVCFTVRAQFQNSQFVVQVLVIMHVLVKAGGGGQNHNLPNTPFCGSHGTDW